jgi:chemotaxis protein MotB
MALAKPSMGRGVDKESLWLMTYISLFTSLLAFFILSVTMVELEGSNVRRNFQKIQHDLYAQVLINKKKLNLDWLEVEETVSKGTRLTLRADRLNNQEIFKKGSDKINTPWLRELQSLVILLEQLNLQDLNTRYANLLDDVERAGFSIDAQLLIEGHTDAQPIVSARFPSNWELSTARALQVQQFLQSRTALPERQFAIAGLGSFRPVDKVTDYASNRRVEIYINTTLTAKGIAP